MPGDKPIATYLGIGRGSFRKAFLSVLLSKYSEENAFELAIKELGDSCIYCGINSKDAKLQPDFLWLQADGDLYKLGNVAPACPSCNSSRSNTNWHDFILSLSNKLSQNEINDKINRINNYMKKYNMSDKPDINQYINDEYKIIQKDLDLLLDSLTQV